MDSGPLARWNTVDAVNVDVFEEIHRAGVLPVVVLDRSEDAEPLAAAVREGGLRCLEVTFRSEAAADALQRMTRAFPDMTIGAGTVMTPAQGAAAVSAGARFVVSPGSFRAGLDWAWTNKVPVIPGALTPTEVGDAMSAGARLVKFFPAEPAGGVRMLQALAGPFPDARFLPTGGIDVSNLASYLRLPNVAACGGSWMVDRRLVAAGDFATIADLCATAARLVAEVRSS